MSSLFSPLKFTGVSKYSSDFQTIIDRAVSIAALPARQAQNDQSDLITKKQLLVSLNTAVENVGSSLTALSKVGTSKGVSGTSSDSTKVSINATNATAPGLYNITEISSIAHAASETSLTGYASSSETAVSASGEMALIFGETGKETTLPIHLDSSSNNLVGLRDAINNLNAGVSASILTTGSGNYLSVSSNVSGVRTLRVVENPGASETDVLTTANQGSNTVFKLNGVQVTKSSTLINDVVPGVSFSVLAKTATDETVSITLESDRSKISSGLKSLVTAYNTAMAQVNAQIGENAGMLSGDMLIHTVQTDLRAIMNYSGTGSVKSLADLGIELDRTGTMSFNEDTFSALSSTNIDDAFSLLGDTTGFGGLAAKFNSLSDPVTGLIKLQQNQYDTTDKRLQSQIDELSTRITNMQAALASKLEVADQLLASLDTQQTMLTANIDSLNYTLYGKNS